MTAPDQATGAPESDTAIKVRLSPQLRDAISVAAKARGMTISTWVRQSAMTCAMLEGVLYPDVWADGRRRFARIEGGSIVEVQYLAAGESADPFRDALLRAVDAT